jgi:membrane-bound lytic murein transglycosylase F
VGAAGLMQLMPRTAANFGLDKQTVFNPEMNIEAGVQYIKSLNLTFRKVENKDERVKFILAGYNSGPAHILDAMALAQKYGKNPQVWFGNVEFFLLKKSEPEFYNDKVVKYGYFRGKQTVSYVHNTLKTFEKYLRKK